jgi:hypothetical protein
MQDNLQAPLVAATPTIITQQQHVTHISPWQMALLAGNLSTLPSPSGRTSRGQGHISCNEQLTQVPFHDLPNPPGYCTPCMVPQDCLKPLLQGQGLNPVHHTSTSTVHQGLPHLITHGIISRACQHRMSQGFIKARATVGAGWRRGFFEAVLPVCSQQHT